MSITVVTRRSGRQFETELSWPVETTAIVDDGQEQVYIVRDQSTGTWREMTEEEEAQERRAWENDQKDMAQIAREWRDYRNEGLGERG